MYFHIAKLIILILILIGFISGVASAERIPILMYHHIREGTGMNKVTKDLSCSPINFWAHLLYIQQNGYRTVTFKDVRNNRFPKDKKIRLTFDDGIISQWDAFDELTKRSMVGVFFPVFRSVEKNRKYLSSDQLKFMSRNGMEIGSHGMTHPVLSRISLKKVEYEVKESKLELEKILNREVITFCYPYGRYNDKVIKIIESVGYHYARTTNERVADFSFGKNFELPIIYIHNYTDVEKLRKQLEAH
jgi:peptidoglycan/xylan/chitin deacetylase (PgdA/CDA1 family)